MSGELEAQAFDASNGSGDVDWDSAEETIDFPEGLGNESNDSEDDAPAMEDNNNETVPEGKSEDSEPEVQDDEEVPDTSDQDSEESESGEKESDSDEDEDGEGEEIESSIPEALQAKGIIENEEGEIGKVVTINGEEQFVSLEELGNDYSGQKELQRRFSEFDNSKRAFNQEVEEVESYIGEFASRMQNGDVVGAFQYFGEFANIAPYQVKESLLQALGPEVERRASMSAQELQAELLQSQNEYLQKQNESALQLREHEQAQRELQSSIESLRETHSISVEEWKEASDYLASEVNENELTPDSISEYVVNLRAYEKADSVIESLQVTEQVDDTYIDSLQRIIKENPDFTDEDLKELVEKSVTKRQEASIGKQLKTRKDKSSPSKKEMKKQDAKIESGDDYEIDPELEDLFG